MSHPCKGNVPRLLALLDGSLRARAADRLRRHLESCPGCTEALDRLRKTRALCRDLGEVPTPDLSWRQIETQIHWQIAQHEGRERGSRRPLWKNLPAIGAVASAAVVGAVIGVIFFGHSKNRPPPIPKKASITVIHQPQHDEELAAVVTLAQGEVNVLSSRGREISLELTRPLIQGDRVLTGNGHVALQWAEATGLLALNETEVELHRLHTQSQEITLCQGRIYFQVGRLLEGQRFSVLAHGIRTSVKGTNFAVALNSEAVEVEVYEGIVEVEPVDRSWTPVEVAASQSIRVPLNSRARPGIGRHSGTRTTSLLNLQPWPSFQRIMAGTGLLAVESTPSGADIRLDAQTLGTTNLTLRSTLGKHLIELLKDGKLLRRLWVDVQLIQGRLALDVRPRFVGSSISRLPAGLHEIFQQRTIQIQACYERRLKHNPALEGKLTLRVAIDKEGHVARATLDSDTLSDPLVGQCALGVIQRWQFPPNQEAELVYPYHFRPPQ